MRANAIAPNRGTTTAGLQTPPKRLVDDMLEGLAQAVHLGLDEADHVGIERQRRSHGVIMMSPAGTSRWVSGATLVAHELADDRGRGLDAVDGADGLAGVQGHRLDRADGVAARLGAGPAPN